MRRSGTQLRLRAEHEARMRASGRTFCWVPTRAGEKCLGWVSPGEQACRAHQAEPALLLRPVSSTAQDVESDRRIA